MTSYIFGLSEQEICVCVWREEVSFEVYFLESKEGFLLHFLQIFLQTNLQ